MASGARTMTGSFRRSGPWLQVVVAVCSICVCLTFGPLWAHNAFLADALVPVHVSLTRWEPFYWGQARYGMLVPLLALPFREPLVNYAVQNFITALCGSSFFFLVAATVLPGSRAVAAGALGLALYVVFDDPDWQHFYFGTISQYATGLCLSLAGFILWRRGTIVWRSAGGACLAAAIWVDVSCPLFLLPWAVLVWLLTGNVRHRLRALRLRGPRQIAFDPILSQIVFVIDCVVLAMIAIPWASMADENLARGFGRLVSFAPSNWMKNSAALGSAWIASIPRDAWIAVFITHAAAFGLVAFLRKPGACRRAAVHLALPAAAVTFRWLLLGASLWVSLNGLHPKYLTPSRVLVFAMAATSLVGAITGLGARDRIWRAIFVTSVIVSIGVLVRRHSLLSGESMRDRMMHATTLTRHGPASVEAGCTHFLGSDVNVWETIFFASEVAYRAGRPPVVGISFKTRPSDVPWTSFSSEATKWCSAQEDFSDVGALARTLGWPGFRRTQRVNHLDIWRPVDASP